MTARRWVVTKLLQLAGNRVPTAWRAKLVEEAELALVAGVQHTRSEWDALAPAERAAWAVAGQRIAAGLAAATGLAAQGPRQAATIASTADGGALLKAVEEAEKQAAGKQALNTAVDRAAAKIAGGR